MEKSKRIIALIGVAFLILLYIVTFIAAIFSSPSFKGLFVACLYSTIIVPILLYAFLMIGKILKKDKENITKDTK